MTPIHREKESRVAEVELGGRELLYPLTGLDVRRLVKAEEELEVASGFERIFPAADTQRYFRHRRPPTVHL